MDHHPGRLVHHHQPVIFKQNVQGNVFRDRVVALGRRNTEPDLLTGANLDAGAYDTTVQFSTFVLHCLPNLRTAITITTLGQKQINPLSCSRLRDNKVAVDVTVL
jgi:hypothetical protein